MTITRLIGDVHGKFGRYKSLLLDSPHPTIQVGDMGVGFRKWPHGDASANPPHDMMVAKGARFIRGNHDNPAACRTQSQYIPDGTIENGVMFVGGAVSIDREWRRERYSWWPNEELSQEALDALIADYGTIKPRVMITHECPESVAGMIVAHLCGGNPKMDPRHASRTRVAFERMLFLHPPKLWVFGHWHVPFDYESNGTRFICLPELATLDVDLEEV